MSNAGDGREQAEENRSAGPRSFPTTLWTVVLSVGQRKSSAADEALAALCRAYWYPLYAFVRRRGYRPQDAEDLTQAFFAHLLATEAIGKAQPAKGRFRTFLLAAVKNFLANEWDKGRALKRGGGRAALAFDAESAEARYQREPSHELTPERLFERRWALSVLDEAFSTLRNEYEQRGAGNLFAALKETLTGGGEGYAAIAAQLGLTEGAVKVAAHRLRGRYRELTRAIVAETVAADEVEDELRHLKAAVSGS